MKWNFSEDYLEKGQNTDIQISVMLRRCLEAREWVELVNKKKVVMNNNYWGIL